MSFLHNQLAVAFLFFPRRVSFLLLGGFEPNKSSTLLLLHALGRTQPQKLTVEMGCPCPCNVGLCFTTVTRTVAITPTNRSSTETSKNGSTFSLLSKYAASYFEYLHRIDLNRELQQQVIDFNTNFEVLNLVLDTSVDVGHIF